MGTLRDNQKSQDEDEGEVIIPWDFASYSVRQELIKRLNPESTLLGNDWRMLADGLGYTTGEIKYIESEKDNNTSLLFKQYDTKPGASVNQVFKVLERMQRQDCMDIIRNSLQEMHQAYMKASESKTTQAARTPDFFSAKGHYQCNYPPCPHQPMSPYGSHPFYPCSHNYASYGSTRLNHHLGACGLPCQKHPSHPHQFQTFSSPSTILKTCDPGFTSPYHTLQAGHTCNINPQVCCYENGAQPVATSSSNYLVNGPALRYNSPCYHPSNTSYSQEYPACPGSPTDNNNQKNQEDNMMANSDLLSLRYRHMYPQDYSLNNGVMVSNVPMALSENLLKLQVNNMPLPNNIIARDDSSIVSSDSSNNNDSFGSRQKMARQFSDECNITQVQAVGKRPRNINNRETISNQDSTNYNYAALPGVTGHSVNIVLHGNNHTPKFVHLSGYTDMKNGYLQKKYEVKERNGSQVLVTNGALGQVVYDQDKNSLEILKKLATVPDKFKPTNEYKTVVAEQQIEVEKPRKEGKGSTSSSSSRSSNGSPLVTSPPTTVPNSNRLFLVRGPPSNVLMAKQEPSVEEIRELSISEKTETFQPVAPCKAYRDIKVFVTYSCDNERHGREVLSLCKFLQNNGFACRVDIREEKNSVKYFQQLEWCRCKFLEADFVLVCISPKYLEDISSASSAFSTESNQRQFHTREIYEMMNSEYLNNQHSFGDEGNICNVPPHRFVPLLFHDMTHNHVPAWMINGSVYAWPKQYKDLAWMLTKPIEKIKRS